MNHDELREAARLFARDYHTHSLFDGYTETEVMKGVFIAYMLLGEYLTTRSLPNPDAYLRGLMDTAAITDTEAAAVSEVAQIAIRLVPVKG